MVDNVISRWGLTIPLRDGARLSASLYLPSDQTLSSPTIVAIGPYTADYHHERISFLPENGYSCLVVDVRGRGNSEGTFHPRQTGEDGYDVIEWVAQQPYCNGKVGMWGGSYLGYTQWSTARVRPPHLVTIVPTASPYRGVDSPLENNIFRTYMMRWLTLVSGRTSQCNAFADKPFWNQKFKQWFEAAIPFNELDEHVGNPSSIFQEWISHPQRDAYWDSYNPTPEQYSKVSIPVLTITGAYDGNQPGALAHYLAHTAFGSPAARSQHYLVIGPWDHAGCGTPKSSFCGLELGPASVIDLSALHLQWYAWVMEHGSRPDFLQKQVSYYVTGREEWRYSDTLAEVTSRFESFYLGSTLDANDDLKAGSLLLERSAEGEPDSYVYDPRDTSHAKAESMLDPDSLVGESILPTARNGELLYRTAPFVNDTLVCGFFRLTAWLSIDQPDTDFCAHVFEDCLDGKVILLTTDWLRARYRENSRVAQLVETNAPLRYDFVHFKFVARQIRKGNRLRLSFGPINSIHWQRNYNSGGVVADESMADARVVTVRLFHDATHQSALYVPLGVEK